MKKNRSEDFAQTLVNPSFTLEPNSTALAIVDMQYATACRTAGRGKILKEKGQEDALEYRFGRIENVVLPNIVNRLRNISGSV